MNRDTFDKAKDLDAQMQRLKSKIVEMRKFQDNMSKESKIAIWAGKMNIYFDLNEYFNYGVHEAITIKEKELEALQKQFVYL